MQRRDGRWCWASLHISREASLSRTYPCTAMGLPWGKGLQGRWESTEVVAASLSSAQGPGCCCPTPWQGKGGNSATSRAGPPGRPQAGDEPAPCCTAAALHGSPTTRGRQDEGCSPAAPGREKEKEQLQQPPCSDFARPQPSPRSWLSLGQHQFLPASHSSPSLQCSEPGSELPPGRNRRQRRKTGRAPSSIGLPAQPLQPPVLCPPSSWGSPPETPNLPPGPESHDDTGRGTLLPGFIGQGGRALQSHQ